MNKSAAKLLNFYVDKNIDGSKPFDVIKEKAFVIATPEQINSISSTLEKKGKDYKEHYNWKAVDKVCRSYKPLLRALLKILPFEAKQHKALLKAVSFLIVLSSNNR